MCTEQKGSRVIEAMLEHAVDAEWKKLLLDAVYDAETSGSGLAMTRYGNYLLQKVLDKASQEEIDRFSNLLWKKRGEYQMHSYAKRVLEAYFPVQYPPTQSET